MRRALVGMVVLATLAGCTGSGPSPAPTAQTDPAPVRSSQRPLRPRAAHTATLLADGRVLLAGGCATRGCTSAELEPTSEFYVPGAGFVAGPAMVHPRDGHTATKLADGRVLYVGGWAREGAAPLAGAEMFDPATSTFRAVGSLQVGRGGHIASLLPDGRVLIAGGWTQSGYAASVEIYDPITESFAPGPPMPGPRDAAVAVALGAGDIMVIGGRDTGTHSLGSTLIYQAATNMWRSGPTLHTPRFKHAATTLTDGRILVLGGTTDDVELLASTEILDGDQFVSGPAMSAQRYKFCDAVAGVNGRLVVAGGARIDLLAEDGTGFNPVGIDGPIRSFATATALPEGAVLIVGGYDQHLRIHGDALLIPVDARSPRALKSDR